LLHPKKVGKIPVAGTDKIKQTNEIKMVKPLLNALNIDGLVITADALLAQREIAKYLVEEKKRITTLPLRAIRKRCLMTSRLFSKLVRSPMPRLLMPGMAV
jgi:hypothetical protein